MICVSATAINSFGLVLDIIGAVLLFFYGLPTGLWSFSQGKTNWKQYLGLLLLIIGFMLQLISNWI